jgi:hypothetical protein
MTMRHVPLVALAAAGLVLAGCSDPAPTPRARPAPVDRPVLALKGPATGVRVPSAALVEHGGAPGLYVLSPINEARFRMVRLGRVVGSDTEILAGLAGDEILVLGDLKSLYDGSPITATKNAK